MQQLLVACIILLLGVSVLAWDDYSSSTDYPNFPTYTPGPSPVQSTDYCSCDLSSLWLDVIFVVDASKAMGKNGLENIKGLMLGVLYSLTYGSSRYQSRVGVVTYAKDVSVPYPLGSLNQNNLDYITLPYMGVDGDNVTGALGAAQDQFLSGPRDKVQQVIVIIASSYNGEIANDPAKIADQFKNDGGKIVAIEYVQPGQAFLPQFSTLGSPGYAIKVDTVEGDELVEIFCHLNCFCTVGLTPYSIGDKATNRSVPNGGCYEAVTAKTVYRAAKITCKDKLGFVAAPHDVYKNYFLMQLFTGSKVPFWIGYEYSQGWKFADNSTIAYTAWGSGQPRLSDGNCAYSVQSTGFNSAWSVADCQNIVKADYQYVCEIRPCDSTYYCY